jgi:hypothetical protein
MRRFLLGGGFVSLFIAFALMFVPYLYPMPESMGGGYGSPYDIIIPMGIFCFFLLSFALTYASYKMRATPSPGTDIGRAVTVASGIIVLLIIIFVLLWVSGEMSL